VLVKVLVNTAHAHWPHHPPSPLQKPDVQEDMATQETVSLAVSGVCSGSNAGDEELDADLTVSRGQVHSNHGQRREVGIEILVVCVNLIAYNSIFRCQHEARSTAHGDW
jgi:hypothetical protein